jgi:sec-independent protein translocase protein TatA
MKNIGMTELLIIVGLVLLLFGGKKIPELMRGLGKGIKEFKTASTDPSDDEVKDPTPATKA